jgi:hypothetical protein
VGGIEKKLRVSRSTQGMSSEPDQSGRDFNAPKSGETASTQIKEPLPRHELLHHYEFLDTQAREEIRLRLSRDSGLQIQLIASIATVAGLSAVPGARNLIIVAPLLGFYFSVAIAHNRWMIANLGRYLREVTESEMGKLAGIREDSYWDTYFSHGPRRWERFPMLDPLIGWGVFGAVYVYLAVVNSLGLEVYLATSIAYLALNAGGTVLVLDWSKRVTGPTKARPQT